MSQPAQEPIEGSAPVKPLTMAATIAALGVVFGDIGTSPLYAFKECLRVKDGDSNILGTSHGEICAPGHGSQ
ncbi:MAG: potassium transporter [Verrucomicrobiota bacterium]